MVAGRIGPVCSRMEDLLVEMRAAQDMTLKKINQLREHVDALTDVDASEAAPVGVDETGR
jgi:hypothetical protein